MDERLGNNAVAARLNIAPVTWRAYVSRGHAPPPDGRDEGFNRDYWLASTIKAWEDQRRGSGNRTPRKQRSQ